MKHDMKHLTACLILEQFPGSFQEAKVIDFHIFVKHHETSVG